ncbi:MAG TPA: prenyltransferase, partial [Methanofastidiosum sp.]|nr:prenyltransferase [Methanofastidiosum sp.]
FFLFSVGALFAVLTGAELEINKFLLGYLILFLGHLSVSYSNDYFDFEADKLGEKTTVSGGSGILQMDPSLRQSSKLIAISLIFISILLGFIFTVNYNYHLIFLGYVIFGNLLGWFYTAPPIRLSYRGLGEISTMIAIGFVVPGMGYYVMKGLIDTNYLLFTIPLLMYGIYFILSVEIPDMETDALSGKKSFVTKNGRKLSLKIIFLAALFATMMYIMFQMTNLFELNLNFFVVSVLSLIPLLLSTLALNKDSRVKSVKIAFNNLNALILFAVLTNLYFLIITMR